MDVSTRLTKNIQRKNTGPERKLNFPMIFHAKIHMARHQKFRLIFCAIPKKELSKFSTTKQGPKWNSLYKGKKAWLTPNPWTSNICYDFVSNSTPGTGGASKIANCQWQAKSSGEDSHTTRGLISNLFTSGQQNKDTHTWAWEELLTLWRPKVLIKISGDRRSRSSVLLSIFWSIKQSNPHTQGKGSKPNFHKC